MEDTSPERIRGADEARSVLKIASARRGPYFYVVDEHLAVVVARLDPDAERAKPDALPRDVAAAADVLRRGLGDAAQDAAVALVRPGLVLRMVRLEGATRGRFVLFLEPFERRDLLSAATKRYGFTNRECDVLDLMLRGESTSAISRRLHIADATVQHHVKNIGAKVGVSKRVEIVAAIVNALG
jgi:DNA-binding CsgD family transcriptional regulator